MSDAGLLLPRLPAAASVWAMQNNPAAMEQFAHAWRSDFPKDTIVGASHVA